MINMIDSVRSYLAAVACPSCDSWICSRCPCSTEMPHIGCHFAEKPSRTGLNACHVIVDACTVSLVQYKPRVRPVCHRWYHINPLFPVGSKGKKKRVVFFRHPRAPDVGCRSGYRKCRWAAMRVSSATSQNIFFDSSNIIRGARERREEERCSFLTASVSHKT